MKKIYTITFLLVTFSVFSQDFKSDMISIRNIYASSENFTTDITVNIYNEKDSDEIFYTQKAMIRKKGQDFYYEIGALKMLITTDKIIMVDESEKEIIYRSISKKEYKNSIESAYIPNVDSILNSYENDVVYKGVKGTNKHYTITSPDFYIAETDLYTNAQNNTIDRIIYLYNQKLWGQYYLVDMLFSNVTINADVGAHFFDQSRFVIKTKGRLQPAEKYKGYELIEVDGDEGL